MEKQTFNHINEDKKIIFDSSENVIFDFRKNFLNTKGKPQKKYYYIYFYSKKLLIDYDPKNPTIDEDEILSLNKNFIVINDLIKKFNLLNIRYLEDTENLRIEKKLIKNINSIYYNIKFLLEIYDLYIELNENIINLLY